MDLTDAQWAILEPVFRPKRRSDWRGRPWRDTRSVLNGVLWILRTGAQWRELPSKYPPYQTCHRRFQSWQRSGLLIRVLQKLAEDLRDRGRKNTQDGRELRRYCHRWKIERLFAWLHNFRRLVTRWEYQEANFLGMLQLGCLLILVRHL